jgi:hypothetical protein
MHAYEVRPRKDKRGVNLISDALPFGRLWYDGPNAASNAIGYASQYSRSHDAVIRVYDDAGNVIRTHEHKGDFKESSRCPLFNVECLRRCFVKLRARKDVTIPEECLSS